MTDFNTISRAEQISAALARWERWALLPIDEAVRIQSFRTQIEARVAWELLSDQLKPKVFIVDLAQGQELSKDVFALREAIETAQKHNGAAQITITLTESAMRNLCILKAYESWKNKPHGALKRVLEAAFDERLKQVWPEIEAKINEAHK